MNGGILYRSHVKKMCNRICFHSDFKDNACTKYMKVAKLYGMPFVECIYLQQCNKAYTIAFKQTPSFGSPKDLLSRDGQLKLLSDSKNSQIFWLPCMTAKDYSFFCA